MFSPISSFTLRFLKAPRSYAFVSTAFYWHFIQAFSQFLPCEKGVSMSDMCISRPNRRLTVGYYRKRHEDRKTKIPTRYSVHAALSLKGDWLEEAGFKTHSRVRVLVEQGKLVIELEAEDAT